MAEPQGGEQWETGGGASCDVIHTDADGTGSVPCWNGMCARIFETSHLEGSYTRDLLQSLLQASLLGLERTAFSASSPSPLCQRPCPGLPLSHEDTSLIRLGSTLTSSF